VPCTSPCGALVKMKAEASLVYCYAIFILCFRFLALGEFAYEAML